MSGRSGAVPRQGAGLACSVASSAGPWHTAGVRGNSNRSSRLAFDSAVDRYDAGRPAFGAEVVTDLIALAELCPGDLVLEVGAGTGQLTAGLVDRGLAVIAVEPGPNMAACLRRRFADRSGLTVVESHFEHFDYPAGSFAAVLSANAFHWADPSVSYHKAAGLLRSDGRLGLMWTFPILADRDLQRRVNDEAFVDDLADFRREPDGYLAELESLLADGRAELTGSGGFHEPAWVMKTQRLVWTVADYIAFLSSMANGIAVADQISKRVTRVLAGVEELKIANHVYVEAAKKMTSPLSL